MADSLRDPRAFRVTGGPGAEISFPADDDVHRAILGGSRPTEFKVETYRAGQVIPAGRLPLSAVGVLLGRCEVEVVEPKTTATAAGSAGGAGALGKPAVRPSSNGAAPAAKGGDGR